MKRKLFGLWLCVSILCLLMAVPVYAAGWKQDNAGWWWQNDDGSYPASEWKEIGGKWYYFEKTGYMASNRWEGNYYLGSDGAMLTDTVTPDGYTVGKDGAWIRETGDMNSNAANAEDGWFHDGKGWRFKEKSGKTLSSCWYTDPKTKYIYYFDGSGYMSVGKTNIDNKWYYFDTDGNLCVNGELEEGVYCTNEGEIVSVNDPGATFYAYISSYPDTIAVYASIINLRNVPITLGDTCLLSGSNGNATLYLLDTQNRRFADSVTIPGNTRKTVAFCSPDLKPVNIEFYKTTAQFDVISEGYEYWFSTGINNAEGIKAEDLVLFHIAP